MPLLRDFLSRNRPVMSRVIGERPYKFGRIPDSFIIRSNTFDELDGAISKARELDFSITRLKNEPIATLKPSRSIDDILDAIVSGVLGFGRRFQERAKKLLEGEELQKKGERVKRTLEQIEEITRVDFNYTMQTMGPESFGILTESLKELTGVQGTIMPTAEEPEEKHPNLNDAVEALGCPDAWEMDATGEGTVIVDFDTSFCENAIDRKRIVNSWSGEEVESAFSAPSEGHGTMTLMTAAASKDENGVVNGMAPEADVIPVRISGPDHGLRGDYIVQAWDYILSKAKANPETNYCTNHSYGTPIGKSYLYRNMVNSNSAFMVRAAASEDNVHPFYASGNEANRYGHRPSGLLTNAINSVNSLAEVLTIGALRFSGNEARSYSSHGFGQDSPIGSPKPDFSARIARYLPYGVSGEPCWETKDMAIRGIPSSSGGGTSDACPSACGIGSLVLSAAPDLNTEELRQVLNRTARTPRPTQVNLITRLFAPTGFDARYGHGEIAATEKGAVRGAVTEALES